MLVRSQKTCGEGEGGEGWTATVQDGAARSEIGNSSAAGEALG